MKLVNLGCGSRYHSAWTNVNFTSTGDTVISCDLTKGIPFSDGECDVVYHSHLLEHFTQEEALFFLHECNRVLTDQGILRIAVPDLEQIACGYIHELEQALIGSQEASDNYDWLLLELFDQLNRNQSGGDMAAYLLQENIPNEKFILARWGEEARQIIELGRSQRGEMLSSVPWYKKTFRLADKFFRSSNNYYREILLRAILGSKDYQNLRVGRFRQSGEIHQWMYDRYSLDRLLKECGFAQVTQRNARDSYIPNWPTFNLDTASDGTVYKPDSLYMEAIKSTL